MNLRQGSKCGKESNDLPKNKKNVRRITLSLADVIDQSFDIDDIDVDDDSRLRMMLYF